VVDLNFSRTENSEFSLTNLNLSVDEGEYVAIVGPSGSGKSTFADLLLGLLEPNRGYVTISGLSPSAAVNKWAGAISYLPQEVHIVAGTIRENVTRGFKIGIEFDKQVYDALSSAKLLDFVCSQPLGLDTVLDDGGSNLSGGQRQRFGIARSLFLNPKTRPISF
jgi:ATP-binding cassette subfamily C protein